LKILIIQEKMRTFSSSLKVIDECAQILGCSLKSLRDHLNHPDNRVRVLKALLGRKVQTTYLDHNGFKKTFIIDGLTRNGASSIMSYGRLPFPYNVSVAAHFYSRHRIRLNYPYLHCIIERFPYGEDRYYPIELLEFVKEKDEEEDDDAEKNKMSKWIDDLSTDITTKLSISESNQNSPIILMKNKKNSPW
jgi:hypothetical protein